MRAVCARALSQVIARKDDAEQPGHVVLPRLAHIRNVGLFHWRILAASVCLRCGQGAQTSPAMPCVRSRAFLRPCWPRYDGRQSGISGFALYAESFR
jgi:hypothetical protein